MRFDPSLVQVLGDHDACGVGFVADRHARSSHALLERGLEALTRLTHRGGGGDALGSADGCGVLTAIPWEVLERDGSAPPASEGRTRSAGFCLAPRDAADEVQRIVERALCEEGWRDIRWRVVPVDAGCLADTERAGRPAMLQVIACDHGDAPTQERRLLRARLRAAGYLDEAGMAGASIVSLCTRTIVYKALVAPVDLARVFPDLRDERYATPFVVFHQRFSTNTFPDWSMAQPFQMVAHNGEINTITGNRLKAARRQADRLALPELADLDAPAVSLSGSDSRSLDDQIALLVRLGLSLPHAVARVLRRAWEHDRSLTADERAFEQYQACLADAWEGPAAVAVADGRFVGLAVDRSGFRPARVIECADGLIVAGSEIGIVDVPEHEILSRGRVGPGEMYFVDLEHRRTLDDRSVRWTLASARPYRRWVRQTVTTIASAHSTRGRDDEQSMPRFSAGELGRRQRQFACTAEELEVILRPMAEHGHEAVGSMGDDTPLAALGSRSRLLPDYFRQRFAQVTNPPLDPLREKAVMSLRTLIGRHGRLTDEAAADARLLAIDSPILTNRQLQAVTRQSGGATAVIPMLFEAAGGTAAFERALSRLCDAACAAVDGGATVVVLSDRDVSEVQAPLPALLATSAVHQALGRAGLGTRAGLVVDTGEARDAHQTAALLAYGAAAVCPWLGYATAAAVGERHGVAPMTALDNYRRALELGLLKILSKMGVCTVEAYRGSQLFEIVGLDPAFAEAYFPATALVAGAVTLTQVAEETCARHVDACRRMLEALPHPGFHGYRHDGDHHMFNPAVVKALHRASRTAADEAYAHFTALLHSRPPTAVRDLLTFRPQTPVPIEEVESVESICARFFASAMSVGALGPEAHRTLAIALNRLGGRSNSGEGGEEPDRYVRQDDGTWANSVTKQVASARFGVTPAYLISARELQIKMAQGSKPGEGGQLPPEKVVDHIARLRHAQPGTALISPPPHHDIYSIEDLAQLIYDLRSFHPDARINVKLVATTGIGVIAAGVVKAGADAIQISGHSGGTGASPRGSIKHAGLPWEIGLTDAHRVLTERGMRDRVVLQTDGGLTSGRDIAMAAALGADEYGFGTAALVALGCVMARQCHLNTCPVGIATQRPDLRAKFAGTVDQVVAYLRLVAAETRQILASLGLRSLGALVGRVDLLQPRTDIPRHGIDVRPLLAPARSPGSGMSRRVASVRRPEDAGGELTLNGRLLRRAGARLGRAALALEAPIHNGDRSVGATVMGVLAAQYGDSGALRAPVQITLRGNAGQSLGAFALPGTEIHLRGAANDGVGKGMHGGVITVSALRAGDVLVGNAALYGATGGRLFVNGRAGERFAVRNSGALAVVEGVGDHGCEYMTGGLVVVLGEVGRNFAAGMTGGLAFVHDPHRHLGARLNRDSVTHSDVPSEYAAVLRELVEEHARRTGSAAARALLDSWPRALRAFRLVMSPVTGGSSHAFETSDAAAARRRRLRPDSGGRAADSGTPLAV